MTIDCNFPLLKYERGQTYRQWGLSHGEQFKDAIKELFEIRKELMIQKNPSLEKMITPLAMEQWNTSKTYSPDLCDELQGIADGSGLSIEDIVILNNYTDFRDIELPDEGCSTVAFSGPLAINAGQTWDMHSSAKNYVNLIQCPLNDDHEALVFSLVGCVGMMGVTTKKTFVGVNNINTDNARAALIWPVLVRDLLLKNNYQAIEDSLINAPVTSGHNYLIAGHTEASHWEVTPTVSKKVGYSNTTNKAVAFHTNHCLDEDIQKLEHKLAVTSTSQDRFKTLEKNKDKLKNYNDLVSILKSHDGHPKSICSHYESGAQDPSATCGGGAFDTEAGIVKMWRGCETYDKNYVEYNFKLEGNRFCQK